MNKKKQQKKNYKHAKKTKLLVNYNRFNDKPSERWQKRNKRSITARIRRKVILGMKKKK